jgi:hypothetical protein
VTTRSTFLASAALGVAAATALDARPASAAGYDLHAMQAILHRPARHKQVIAATRVAMGTPLRYAGNGLNAFEFALGEGTGSLQVVCVLYGASLFFALNDGAWDRYRLFDVLDHAGESTLGLIRGRRNPFYHARSLNPHDAPDDQHGFYHDISVEALTRRGVSWFVCDNALHSVARDVAQMQGEDPDHVYHDLRGSFVPGALLVPAGVAAIVLAQEARFTFLFGES